MRQYIPAFRLVQLCLDLLVVQGALYLLTERAGTDMTSAQTAQLGLVSSLLMAAVYQWQRVYHGFRAGGLRVEAGALLRAWVTVLVILALLAWATDGDDPIDRSLLSGWAALGLFAQLAVHAGTASVLRVLRGRGFNVRRTLLVGDASLAEEFAAHLQREQQLGIQVLGLVSTAPTTEPPAGGAALPCLGPACDLTSIIRRIRADLVLITMPLEQSARIEALMDELIALHLDVHWAPDLSVLRLLHYGVYEVGGRPVLRLTDSPFVGLRRAAKWIEDMALAALLLLVAAPVMAGIALAVKLTSPGPVIFRQRRSGLNGKQFVAYKFRTMVPHAEPDHQVTQAIPGDPRLTPIGGFLRRNSLDELPQLLNVLQGHMSLVGPRPHALAHDSSHARNLRAYMLRHRVKPGVTGWAQVNGWRGPTDTPEKLEMRVKYDMYYINHWSLSFDLIIMAMTAWQMIAGRNAW